MSKYLKNLVIISLVILIFNQCKQKDSRHPNISDIEVTTEIFRFEKDLFAIDTLNMASGLAALDKKYPRFYPVFIAQVLEATTTPKDYSSYAPLMKEFITMPSMLGLYDTVQDVFGNFKPYEREISQMMVYYKYYFPKQPTPKVYTFISEFVQGAFTYDKDILGLGLDLHLGAKYRYYPALNIPSFIIKKLEPKYLVTDAAEVLLTNLVGAPVNGKLLDMMLYTGKIAYGKSLLLPDRPEEDIMYYSKKDLQWCEDNEKEIWAFFIEHDLLYKVRQDEYYKYIQDGPTTFGMPQGAPSRVGVWTGYKIVKAYMDKNKDRTLSELFATTDAQKILEESGYKPKRK